MRGPERAKRAAARLWPLLGGLAGAGLAAALFVHYGLSAILTLMARAGAGVLAVIAFHGLQLWLTGTAWQALLPTRAQSPSIATLVLLRWIREGINSLLPFAQIGGIVAAVRLLGRRNVPLAEAVAATIVDLSLEMVTQAAFTLVGLALLFHALGAVPAVFPLLIGLSVVFAMVGALLLAQWLGLARLAERIALRLGWSTDIAGLHNAIIVLYRRRRAIAFAAAFHFLAWGLGAVEVCLALHFLGRDVSLAQGFVIESLGQMLKIAGFAVPASLGVQEGGYVLACGLVGVSAPLALALSLVKRLREIVLGAPSLWAWLRLERAAMLPGAGLGQIPVHRE